MLAKMAVKRRAGYAALGYTMTEVGDLFAFEPRIQRPINPVKLEQGHDANE